MKIFLKSSPIHHRRDSTKADCSRLCVGCVVGSASWDVLLGSEGTKHCTIRTGPFATCYYSCSRLLCRLGQSESTQIPQGLASVAVADLCRNVMHALRVTYSLRVVNCDVCLQVADGWEFHATCTALDEFLWLGLTSVAAHNECSLLVVTEVLRIVRPARPSMFP